MPINNINKPVYPLNRSRTTQYSYMLYHTINALCKPRAQGHIHCTSTQKTPIQIRIVQNKSFKYGCTFSDAAIVIEESTRAEMRRGVRQAKGKRSCLFLLAGYHWKRREEKHCWEEDLFCEKERRREKEAMLCITGQKYTSAYGINGPTPSVYGIVLINAFTSIIQNKECTGTPNNELWRCV